MIAAQGAALFTLVAVLVALIGGFAMAAWAKYADMKDREAKLEWEHEMQPNLRNVVQHQPFDQDDILETRPLLPAEYDRYLPVPDNHRAWKAGR